MLARSCAHGRRGPRGLPPRRRRPTAVWRCTPEWGRGMPAEAALLADTWSRPSKADDEGAGRGQAPTLPGELKTRHGQARRTTASDGARPPQAPLQASAASDRVGRIASVDALAVCSRPRLLPCCCDQHGLVAAHPENRLCETMAQHVAAALDQDRARARLCGNQNFTARSRRPPRHRRDACWMA